MPPASGARCPDAPSGPSPLLTDLYQLTMLQAYWREGMDEEAVFSLFVRRLPKRRNFLLACGLDDALSYLENLRFSAGDLDDLRGLGPFQPAFLAWLGDFRFTGSVWALPEGTPFFAEEPILEIEAPLPEGQLVETFLMNQIQLQTVLASKGARVVEAAAGRPVIDFGLRRMHGADAGLKAARAFHIAGLAGTSNVLAGKVYGMPLAGTMAHSYVQSHDDELDAFRRFAELYPETVLLVDTYDTLEGVAKVIELAREMARRGEELRVKALRLDSGDLATMARGARALLDEAGLSRVELFASGGLDEDSVAALVAAADPVDGFGVGTALGVSRDAPVLDIVYKLTAYAGRGRVKLSPGKRVIPRRKQVFRQGEKEETSDVLAQREEDLPGRPLLVKVMDNGERLDAGKASLDESRRRARREIDRLPARLRELSPADPPFEVRISPRLEGELAEAKARARSGNVPAVST